jgi:hypothetical protein
MMMMQKLSFAGAEYGYDTDRGRCLVAFTAHDCCLKHGAHALQYTPRGLTLVFQMGFKMSMISAAVISFTGRTGWYGTRRRSWSRAHWAVCLSLESYCSLISK